MRTWLFNSASTGGVLTRPHLVGPAGGLTIDTSAVPRLVGLGPTH